MQTLSEHVHFVNGVSWDPLNKYLITQSFDKTAKVYKNAMVNNESKFFFSHSIKSLLRIEDGETYNLFLDQGQDSFVKRCSWSPDGAFCLMVGGFFDKTKEFCTWGFLRKKLDKPSFYLSSLDATSNCCRFCPIFFEKKETENRLIDLAHDFVFAIGTSDSVILYSTHSTVPLYYLTNIHLQPIIDLSWKGAEMLGIGSTDGYISFCSFEVGELGNVMDKEDVPENIRDNYERFLNIKLEEKIESKLNVVKEIKPVFKTKPEVKEEKKRVEFLAMEQQQTVREESNKLRLTFTPLKEEQLSGK